MSQNLMLDPKTKDYVVANGAPIPTDDVRVSAYYALLIPQGQWLYGEANQGSLLYTLNNVKRSSGVDQNFAAYAKQALQTQLVETGQANDLAIQNTEATRTTTRNDILVTPNETQISSQLGFVSV